MGLQRGRHARDRRAIRLCVYHQHSPDPTRGAGARDQPHPYRAELLTCPGAPAAVGIDGSVLPQQASAARAAVGGCDTECPMSGNMMRTVGRAVIDLHEWLFDTRNSISTAASVFAPQINPKDA